MYNRALFLICTRQRYKRSLRDDQGIRLSQAQRLLIHSLNVEELLRVHEALSSDLNGLNEQLVNAEGTDSVSTVGLALQSAAGAFINFVSASAPF
jgi:hypothetical protein